jgi:tripartite-type tricarboxylate transporter receptor subunit TctC
MTHPILASVVGAVALAVVTAGAQGAGDADYPNRPITVVVPYPAGGIVDVRARQLTDIVSRDLGVRLIVDNRPGGLGGIAASHVARAKPDGYTLLAGTINELVVVPASGAKLPFESLHAFAPITITSRGGMVLVVPSSLGVRTMGELAALAKERPGELHYGTVGVGSLTHFPGKLLERAFGTALVDVPYKGAAHSLPDLLAGRTQLQFDFVATALPHIKAGTLRPLMVTVPQRVPLLPDVPTAKEAGYPDLEIVSWSGYLAPAGTPAQIVNRLNAAFAKALTDPQIQRAYLETGTQAVSCSPRELAALIKAERERWDARVASTGIRLAQP